jgi:23S rRNA pseudouridine1911/1915/1917 synthase
MTSTPEESFTVQPEDAGKTAAALLRQWLTASSAPSSWSQVRKLFAGRRVKINGELWLDDARRLKEGDTMQVLARPAAAPRLIDHIPIRYIDTHVVVVEKPAGISTVHHPAERDWLEERRLMTATLDDLVLRQIGERLPKKKHDPRPRLRIVQRLDKQTSGLVVFARTVEAERGLGLQFRRHTVVRRYLTIVPGKVTAQTVRTHLVRDRGDGRRGSTQFTEQGKEAITHLRVEEFLPGYTLLSCQLETGKTHQIRIHLSELGHPVCGETVYNRLPDGTVREDTSGAPRLALHATELGFVHPVTEEPLHYDMPLPPDLQAFLERLRGG